MTYGDDKQMDKRVGGAVYKAGHGELGAQQRSMAMTATTMAHTSLAWLELRQWWVDEVEEVMDKRCA